jgi:GT2 family glycosyltransferase
LTRGRPRALPAAEYREEAPAVGYATFVGLLVRAGVARALDPPVGEFFLWADDYEYSVRLGRHGQIRLIPASVIVHKDARRPFLTRRARLVNRLLGWEHASTRYDAAWRNFFGLRNYVWMLREHERLSPLGAAGVFAQFVAKAVLYDERPLARIPWLARYAWRGWKGDFDNSIAEQWPPPRRWNRASVR